MSCRERLEAYLRQHGVTYELASHREVYTAQEVAAAAHVPGIFVAKVVIASVDGTITALVLPAPYRVDIPRLVAALGAREARLAREEEFGRLFPDCEVGAMPPFANLYGVPVVVDRALAGAPRIVFSAGTHREAMTVAFADFQRLVQPVVAEFTQTHALKR